MYVISELSINPDKSCVLQISGLMSLNESMLSEVLCSGEQLQQYMTVPDDLDVVDVLCGLNTSILMQEFEQQFRLNHFIQQVRLDTRMV